MPVELEALWGAVETAVTSPMQTLEWISACYHAFGTPDDRWVVGVDRADAICAVAPLVKVRHGLTTRLELVGVDRLYEPTDLVATDAEAMEKLAAALVTSRMPITLGRLPGESRAVQTIKEACKGRALVVERTQKPYPYIPLDEKWDVPENNISSKRRSDFRRAWRHAHDMGSVSIAMYCPSAQEIDTAIEQAMAVESLSWKGDQGDDMASNQPIGDFFREYARKTAASGFLRMGFLHIGGELAAMQIGTVFANNFWVLKVAYDPKFHRASPGLLLMVEAIKYARSVGLRTYELLGTAEPWTRVWTESERTSVSLRIYPATVRGAVALAGDALGKVKGRLERSKKSA